jgi:hypothetical protein
MPTQADIHQWPLWHLRHDPSLVPRRFGLRFTDPPCACLLEHDPEKCAAVFRKDHAQSKT